MSSVTGQAQLREVERRLLTASEVNDKAVAKHLRKVPPKVEKLVKAEVPLHMPHTGGYSGVLERAIETKSSVRIRVGLTMTVWAKGKKERRDLPTINRGRLRHPLYGNRGHWFTTNVRKGVVDDAFDKAVPLLHEAVRDARDDTADYILGR